MRQYFEQSDDDAEYDAGSAEDGKGADGRIDVQQAIDVRFAGELRALRGAGDEDRFSDLGESALPAGFQRFVFEHGRVTSAPRLWQTMSGGCMFGGSAASISRA